MHLPSSTTACGEGCKTSPLPRASPRTSTRTRTETDGAPLGARRARVCDYLLMPPAAVSPVGTARKHHLPEGILLCPSPRRLFAGKYSDGESATTSLRDRLLSRIPGVEQAQQLSIQRISASRQPHTRTRRTPASAPPIPAHARADTRPRAQDAALAPRARAQHAQSARQHAPDGRASCLMCSRATSVKNLCCRI